MNEPTNAPVASGTPQCLHPTEDDLPLRFCVLPFGHYGTHRWESTAPAAPGVDFEKAMDELGSVVWAFHAKEHKADFRALVTRIREGHRALIDAAVSKANDRNGELVNTRLAEERAKVAPLLALVKEWQAAWGDWKAHNGCYLDNAERIAIEQRRDTAEAALAAWRKG